MKLINILLVAVLLVTLAVVSGCKTPESGGGSSAAGELNTFAAAIESATSKYECSDDALKKLCSGEVGSTTALADPSKPASAANTRDGFVFPINQGTNKKLCVILGGQCKEVGECKYLNPPSTGPGTVEPFAGKFFEDHPASEATVAAQKRACKSVIGGSWHSGKCLFTENTANPTTAYGHCDSFPATTFETCDAVNNDPMFLEAARTSRSVGPSTDWNLGRGGRTICQTAEGPSGTTPPEGGCDLSDWTNHCVKASLKATLTQLPNDPTGKKTCNSIVWDHEPKCAKWNVASTGPETAIVTDASGTQVALCVEGGLETKAPCTAAKLAVTCGPRSGANLVTEMNKICGGLAEADCKGGAVTVTLPPQGTNPSINFTLCKLGGGGVAADKCGANATAPDAPDAQLQNLANELCGPEAIRAVQRAVVAKTTDKTTILGVDKRTCDVALGDNISAKSAATEDGPSGAEVYQVKKGRKFYLPGICSSGA